VGGWGAAAAARLLCCAVVCCGAALWWCCTAHWLKNKPANEELMLVVLVVRCDDAACMHSMAPIQARPAAATSAAAPTSPNPPASPLSHLLQHNRVLKRPSLPRSHRQRRRPHLPQPRLDAAHLRHGPLGPHQRLRALWGLALQVCGQCIVVLMQCFVRQEGLDCLGAWPCRWSLACVDGFFVDLPGRAPLRPPPPPPPPPPRQQQRRTAQGMCNKDFL
jgi:hypothetical protein